MNILSQPQQPQLKPTNHVSDQLNSSTPKPNTPTTTHDTKTKNDMKNNNNNKNKVLWDCGSSLYDSFELDSFRKQLDYAIVNSSRTLSMPRLPSDNHRAPPQPQPLKKPTSSSKLSRSIQKLLRSVFRSHKPDKNTQKPDTSPDPWFFDSPAGSHEDNKYYVVYEKPNLNNGPNGLNGLGIIPEVPEDKVSPQIGSLARRTMSDRFTSTTSRGIYCA